MHTLFKGTGAVLAGAAIAIVGFAGANENGSPSNTDVVEQAQLTGKFLHLSDIHFNPYYDDKHLIVQHLPVDQWKQHFDANAPFELDFRYDSNFSLMMSALTAAAAAEDYDFILYTGDYLAHDFREHAEAKPWVKHPGTTKPVDDPIEFAAKTVEFVNLMIEETLGEKPIVAALGNNDAGCGDYNLRVGEQFLKQLGPQMPNMTDAERTAFEDSGFYSIAHPTVANVDFLVLGTFWSGSYPDVGRGCGTPSGNPATAQANWLKNTLSPADPAAAGRSAILLMHIPPGIDGHNGSPQWGSAFEQAFANAVPNSKRPIIGAFAGHTHMNELRVLSGDNGPYLAVRLAPSVTTYNGNLPSFTIADYDTSTGAMTDYQVYSYRPENSGGSGWLSEYRFSNAYGVSGFTPANVSSIANTILTKSDGGDARDKYLRYYRGKDSSNSGSNWQDIICAISNTSYTDFNQCTSTVR